MKPSDLRSNEVRLLIYIFAITSTIGVLIPTTAYFIDEQITIDLIGIDKSGSVGLGVIMVATTGGIGMAFVVKRRFMFTYYENCYCKKTGEQMYEDDNHERLFCPTHGEQQMEWQTPDDRHYEYLTKDEREQSIQSKKIGKKYHKSQETARESMSKWTRESRNAQYSRSTLDQIKSAGHTHGISSGGNIPKKQTKRDLEDKIGTLNEKLATLDKQLQEGRKKKEMEKKKRNYDDDDDDLLGMGLGLSL